jgi:phosphopantothenoylcysteine decarboxylase/phosphopantothenate--cysteine ligase
MLDAVLASAENADVFIAAEPVADWRIAKPFGQKLKKQPGQTELTLKLIRNPDIVATVAQQKNRPSLVIGFAAETEHVLEHARTKLISKELDMIVANEVGEGKAFSQPTNAVWLLHREGHECYFAEQPKTQLAQALVKQIANWSEYETKG